MSKRKKSTRAAKCGADNQALPPHYEEQSENAAAVEDAAALVDSRRATQETLHLVGIPGMRDSIREGIETPSDACDTDLEW